MLTPGTIVQFGWSKVEWCCNFKCQVSACEVELEIKGEGQTCLVKLLGIECGEGQFVLEALESYLVKDK